MRLEFLDAGIVEVVIEEQLSSNETMAESSCHGSTAIDESNQTGKQVFGFMSNIRSDNAAVESGQIAYDAVASESDTTSTTVRLLSSDTRH